MPNFDRTGPNGEGPRTGRQMGRCGGKNRSSSRFEDEPGHRHGSGSHHSSKGRGMGRRRRFDT